MHATRSTCGAWHTYLCGEGPNPSLPRSPPPRRPPLPRLQNSYSPDIFGCCPQQMMAMYGSICPSQLVAARPSPTAPDSFCIYGDGMCTASWWDLSAQQCVADQVAFVTRALQQADRDRLRARAGACRALGSDQGRCMAGRLSRLPTRQEMVNAWVAGMPAGPAVCPRSMGAWSLGA